MSSGSTGASRSSAQDEHDVTAPHEHLLLRPCTDRASFTSRVALEYARQSDLLAGRDLLQLGDPVFDWRVCVIEAVIPGFMVLQRVVNTH